MAGLVEKAFGARGIVIEARTFAGERPVRDRKHALRGARIAIHERADDEVAIDGGGDGLAHARILKQRIANVEAEILDLRAFGVGEAEVGAAWRAPAVHPWAGN